MRVRVRAEKSGFDVGVPDWCEGRVGGEEAVKEVGAGAQLVKDKNELTR